MTEIKISQKEANNPKSIIEIEGYKVVECAVPFVMTESETKGKMQIWVMSIKSGTPILRSTGKLWHCQ